jgi:putative DNA-invertase from lambdoid prophage Rac
MTEIGVNTNNAAQDRTRCAIWARVSTEDQHTENQLAVLRQWAQARGLEVAAEFVTEDSAWAQGGGNGKGREFGKARAALEDGARLGRYSVVLMWAIDRLSRQGIEDTLGAMRRLYEHGADIWSHQEPWLVTAEPRMRELLVSFMAWMAEQASARHSERVKAAIARRRAAGLPVGRPPGSQDRKPRKRSGYVAAWEDGGAAREAAERRRADSRNGG